MTEKYNWQLSEGQKIQPLGSEISSFLGDVVYHSITTVNSVYVCSVTQSCPTLRDPMDCRATRLLCL